MAGANPKPKPLEANLYAKAREYRAALLARDSKALKTLSANYTPVRRRLLARIASITNTIENTPEDKRSPAWLWQIDRAKQALKAMEADLKTYYGRQEAGIAKRQAAEYVRGAEDSGKLLAMGTRGNFTAPNLSGIKEFVGFAGDGTPLGKLLAEEGAAAAAGIKEAINYHLLAGTGTEGIRREILGIGEVPKLRAWRISRTETIRAYREGATEAMIANSAGILGWEWLAAMDGRTCAGCLAMNGRRFPNNISMQSHVLCRCTQVPVTLTPKEAAGAGGVAPKPITKAQGPANDNATQYLDGLNDRQLAQTLGSKAAALAYKDGAVSIQDFLIRNHNEDWGWNTGVRSLTGILGKEGAREYFIGGAKAPVAIKPSAPKAPPVVKPKKAPAEEAWVKTINNIEKAIVEAPVEHGHWVDIKTGKELGSAIGDAFSVSVPRENWAELRGNVFTHNHPSGNANDPGYVPSFSEADIRMFTAHAEGEARATTKYGTVRMIATKAFTSMPLEDTYNYWLTTGEPRFKAAKFTMKKKIEKLIEGKTFEEAVAIDEIANKSIHHNIWMLYCNNEPLAGPWDTIVPPLEEAFRPKYITIPGRPK